MFYGSEQVVAVKVRQYVVVYTKEKALIELNLGIPQIASFTKAIIVKAIEMNSLRRYDRIITNLQILYISSRNPHRYF